MGSTGVLNRDVENDQASESLPGKGTHYIIPEPEDGDGNVIAKTVQTIQAEPMALYKLWRDLSHISRWQEHVVSVTDLGGGKSHWVMGDPEDSDGKRVEFDSEITQDEPGKLISWRSITPEVEQSGTVTFAPTASGRGTLVTLEQSAKVPGGSAGNAIAGAVKRSPRQTVIENLRHFKQLAETGEIPSVKGQPHGPRGLSGSIKEWFYGETNPTPPGTSVDESRQL